MAVGFLAGLVFALFSATVDLEGYSSNTEQYGVAPMVGAWWLATRREWWATGLAGGLTAFAALMNPAFVVVAPFVAYELWASSSAGRGRRFAWAVAGVAVVAVPILLWIGLSHAFGDMLEQVFGYARSGVGVGGGGGGGRFWHVPAPALWCRPPGGAVAMRDARLRRVAIPALAWIVVAWLRVKVANYSYSHHYYPALPGIAAGIAVGIGSLWRRSLLERVAICALVLAAPLWSEVLRFQGHGLREPATLRFYKTASHPYHLVYPVSAFIRSHTAPSDTIYMAAAACRARRRPERPGVYWLADRNSATRFIDTPPARWVPSGYASERRWELLTHPPRAIGLMPEFHVDPDLQDVFRRYRYRLAYRINGARVWLRPGAVSLSRCRRTGRSSSSCRRSTRPARSSAPSTAIPREWVDEIILVDDNSTDETRRARARAAAPPGLAPAQRRLRRQPEDVLPGGAAARRRRRGDAAPRRPVRARADPGAWSSRSCAARPTSCSARASPSPAWRWPAGCRAGSTSPTAS